MVSMAPRIPPLAFEDRDQRTNEVLGDLIRTGEEEMRIFTTLAHHPRLLKRWSAFGGALLFGAELSDRDRELLILRVGWLCNAPYEWGQHVIIGRQAGLTDEEIRSIARGPDDEAWSTDDASLLQAADDLHADNRISDETWADLSQRYNKKQLIEICMVVGQYHLVAFTLNSLGVEPEPGLPVMPAGSSTRHLETGEANR